MRAAMILVARDRSAVVLVVMTLCLSTLTGFGGGRGVLSATTSAAILSGVFVTIIGAVMTASVWGAATDADYEMTAHLGGTPARSARIRLLAAILLTLMVAAAVIASAGAAGGALGLGEQERSGTSTLSTWEHLRVAAAMLVVGVPTSVAMTAVLSQGRSRSVALALAVPACLVPAAVQFGPPVAGKSVVVALWPSTAPIVLAAGTNVEPGPVVALAATSVALTWGALLAVMRSRSPSRVVQLEPGSEREPRHVRVPSRRLLAIPGLAVVLVATFGPFVAQSLPLGARPAAWLQTQRGTDPGSVVSVFLDTYAQGRIQDAASLTVAGDAVTLMSAVPASLPTYRGRQVILESSPTVREADVRVRVGGGTFHACLQRVERAWKLAAFRTQVCV